MNDTMTLTDDIILALGGDITDNIRHIVQNHIASGKADLIQSGIVSSKVVESDPLIYTALFQYVLSQMDNVERREVAENSYAIQKDKLRRHIDYIK